MSGTVQTELGVKDRRARAGTALGWVALAMILGGALGRASVAADPMPFWDTDPLVTLTSKTGLGPTMRGVLDILALLGCGVAIVGSAMSGGGVRTRMVVLLGLGFIGVALHGLVLPVAPAASSPVRGGLDDLLLGGAWAGALAGGVGLAHLRGRARRVALAACLGFVVMLAGKGAFQQLVEHPLTVQDYEAQRENVLAARGWSPDSTMAQAFERRLRQNDASGWFGLSNVYATFGATGLVVLAGLGVSAARRRMPRPALALALGGASALAIVLMSHSKGGLGAAAIGLGAGALLGFGVARGRWRTALMVAAPAGVLAIIIVRGLLGERLGELSLLFRWHYMQGSVRMILEHPLVGVGPGGFKEAYLLTRPALGVEEVTSPHSVVLDWVSTLGVFGLAWCGLGLALVVGTGDGALSDPEHDEAPSGREDLMILTLLGAGVTGMSATLESAMGTPESAMMRLLGLAGWVVVAWGVLRVVRGERGRWVLGAMGGGAAVIAAHSMIEVTPVWANSAALLAAMLGLLCGRERENAGRRPGLGVAIGLGASVLMALVLARGLVSVGRWERSLELAAERVQPAAQIRDRLMRLGAQGGVWEDNADSIRWDLGEALGEDAATSGDSLDSQLRRLTQRGGEEAYEILERALEQRPDHLATRQALGRLALTLTELSEVGGQDEDAALWRGRAIEAARIGTQRRPSNAAAWSWLGSTHWALWSRGQNPENLRQARRAWARAHELDPLGLTLVVRLMDTSDQLGEREEAARWAGEALRLDGLKRLDPLKQLSGRERARAGRLSEAGAGAGPGP